MAADVSPPPCRRVLLGQLVANGDCLFATTVARQIKHDDPGCHLTWAISSRCRHVLRHNPHVNEVWELEMPRAGDLRDHWSQAVNVWESFKREARARMDRGEYDAVYLTQIDYERIEDYDGTVRSFIYKGYPGPITVPINPVIRLEEEEVQNVERFVADHPVIAECTHVILFECAPKSGQSFVTPDYALEVSRALVSGRRDVCVVLSSNLTLETGDERILDASTISFRENAELTKHCSLLIGCSSGISWLGTSDWAKKLPTVQLLTNKALWPNSLLRDHERQGLPTDHILEMIDRPVSDVIGCVSTILERGFPTACAQYSDRISLKYTFAGNLNLLLFQGRYRIATRFFLTMLRRYNLHLEITTYLFFVVVRFMAMKLKNRLESMFGRACKV